jgi:hypothetical protein
MPCRDCRAVPPDRGGPAGANASDTRAVPRLVLVIQRSLTDLKRSGIVAMATARNAAAAKPVPPLLPTRRNLEHNHEDVTMWRQFRRTWTVDRPAILGDRLWQVLVVELAALLDRLTWRQVIAFVPVLILLLAYAHTIPLPPEALLVSDMLAYIDVYSIILLVGLLGRAATILYVVRQAARFVIRLGGYAYMILRRPGSRHRRTSGPRNRPRWIVRAKNDDDGLISLCGIARA